MGETDIVTANRKGAVERLAVGPARCLNQELKSPFLFRIEEWRVQGITTAVTWAR